MADWFKHFFGFPGNNEGMPDHFQEKPTIDREEDIYRDFGTFHYPPSSFAEASDMFRHVEEMFKHFESMFDHFGHENFSLPSIEGPQGSHMEDKSSDSLRDKMLKIPDSSMDRKKGSLFGGWTEDPKMMDTDLDAKIATEPLDKIITEISPETPRFHENHLYNRSVSVRISSANGKIEEHKTVKDSDGNVNTTVRRSLGDQTHVITTKSDGSGQSERREDFINMGEEDLKDFENRWKAPKRLPLLGEESAKCPRDEILREKDSSYFNILRNFFGRDPNSN